MARVPICKSMADKLVEGGFQNVFFPVIPEESINGNGVYIGVQQYDEDISTIEDQYSLTYWQVMVRGDKLTSYKDCWEVTDNIRQYLINLPARFTINNEEYSCPEKISGANYFKDSNDRDVFTMNFRTYQNPFG